MNHAAVVVGYGKTSEDEGAYWIVKNSWGTEWGDQGYFLAERHSENGIEAPCGIAREAVLAAI